MVLHKILTKAIGIVSGILITCNGEVFEVSLVAPNFGKCMSSTASRWTILGGLPCASNFYPPSSEGTVTPVNELEEDLDQLESSQPVCIDVKPDMSDHVPTSFNSLSDELRGKITTRFLCLPDRLTIAQTNRINYAALIGPITLKLDTPHSIITSKYLELVVISEKLGLTLSEYMDLIHSKSCDLGLPMDTYLAHHIEGLWPIISTLSRRNGVARKACFRILSLVVAKNRGMTPERYIKFMEEELAEAAEEEIQLIQRKSCQLGVSIEDYLSRSEIDKSAKHNMSQLQFLIQLISALMHRFGFFLDVNAVNQ